MHFQMLSFAVTFALNVKIADDLVCHDPTN